MKKIIPFIQQIPHYVLSKTIILFCFSYKKRNDIVYSFFFIFNQVFFFFAFTLFFQNNIMFFFFLVMALSLSSYFVWAQNQKPLLHFFKNNPLGISVSFFSILIFYYPQFFLFFKEFSFNIFRPMNNDFDWHTWSLFFCFFIVLFFCFLFCFSEGVTSTLHKNTQIMLVLLILFLLFFLFLNFLLQKDTTFALCYTYFSLFFLVYCVVVEPYLLANTHGLEPTTLYKKSKIFLFLSFISLVKVVISYYHFNIEIHPSTLDLFLNLELGRDILRLCFFICILLFAILYFLYLFKDTWFPPFSRHLGSLSFLVIYILLSLLFFSIVHISKQKQ